MERRHLTQEEALALLAALARMDQSRSRIQSDLVATLEKGCDVDEADLRDLWVASRNATNQLSKLVGIGSA